MKFVGITRKPIFWILFFLASGGGIFFSYHFFSKALSIVNLDVKMDRNSALRKAKELADKHGWGPQDFRQATSFESDQNTQIFVELEGGGKKAFNRMLENKLYEPYTWRVRHFKQSEKHETLILFTPKGKSYGFRETISENDPGPDLSSEQAENIAKKEATEKWDISFEKYTRVESSKKIHPSKRADHTFVYERPERNIKEGRYRLNLVVSGDKLTQLIHSVKVPDDFLRRYQEMRAANTTIATAASLLMFLLYLLAGCLLSLFFLFRTRYLVWKTPLFWAGILAFLNFASGVNNISVAWMQYDTALSAGDFLIRYLVQIAIGATTHFIMAALVFSVAESLTRKAFGNQIQFWNLWKPGVANSPAVVGRTVAGYIMVSLQLSLVIGTYLFANKFFGWWWPSDILTSPNILATYFPWLSSVSASLSAGFVEECLFRAIPLAGAALIGRKLGKEKLWIIAAFILQAIIFGAAHASYPAQPAYARLVELIIPSFVFGGIYLAYGLLPAILSHVTFDLVLMSLPLFVSSAPGMWTHRMMVIFAASIPLIMIIVARLRAGKFQTIQEKNYNKSWFPPPLKKNKSIEIPTQTKQIHLNGFAKKLIGSLGALGLAAWIFFTPFAQESPPLQVSRTEAIELAQKELKKRNIQLDETWRPLTILSGDYRLDQQANMQHRFMWQSDKKLAKKLTGTYLMPARWIVRFVTFNGDISRRSEEYQVTITKDGNIIRFSHKLPESQAGAKLTEPEARTVAHNFLINKLKLQPEALKEISANSKKQPNRLDWTFHFSNPSAYTLEEGEARISVQISGDKVTDDTRYIFVPETWKRLERQRANREGIIKLMSILILFLIVFLALLKGNGTSFSFRFAIYAFFILLTSALFSTWNTWPTLVATLNTSEPFSFQLFALLSKITLGNILYAGFVALLFGLALSHKKMRNFTENIGIFFSGVFLGLILLGLGAVGRFYTPQMRPLWATFDQLNTHLPTIRVLIIVGIMSYIFVTLLVLLVFGALDRKYKLLKKNRFILPSFFILAGIAIQGTQELITIPAWITGGMLSGLLLLVAYRSMLRTNRHIIVPILATLVAGSFVQQALFGAYPGAFIAYLMAAIVVMLTSVFLFTRIR